MFFRFQSSFRSVDLPSDPEYLVPKKQEQSSPSSNVQTHLKILKDGREKTMFNSESNHCSTCTPSKFQTHQIGTTNDCLSKRWLSHLSKNPSTCSIRDLLITQKEVTKKALKSRSRIKSPKGSLGRTWQVMCTRFLCYYSLHFPKTANCRKRYWAARAVFGQK